jgi:ubiquinone/menaquinone biosynthesis C-methylase UbiE
MLEVEEFWDSVANIYEECNDKVSEVHHQRYNEALKYLGLRKNSRVLNVWSRTGIATKFIRMKEPELELYNAELSSEMIKRAKVNFPDEKFEKVDLLKLHYPDNYFDEVISLETIEHVQSPLKYLGELYRVLKPQGRLVMSAPPATAELILKVYDTFFDNHGEGPHKFLSSRVVKHLLGEVGFELVEHRGTLLIPVKSNVLRGFGEWIINTFQKTFVSELGIRQFYIAVK